MGTSVRLRNGKPILHLDSLHFLPFSRFRFRHVITKWFNSTRRWDVHYDVATWVTSQITITRSTMHLLTFARASQSAFGYTSPNYGS